MLFQQYDDVLTVDEVSEALKIGKNALYDLLNSGQLRGYRNGRTWRIPRESLAVYIREQTGL